ncbi:sensor histidine kinase [Streptomyces avicenniae]|uniref:sensor histidine kinase n=1 Tax=Streptomyces avicenniae TaxID=500153 RepID=UPI0006996694|nr:histidine kinase [Streptomyces avicenniae]
MTEQATTTAPAPHRGTYSELLIARRVLRGLWDDLGRGATAQRLLPPLPLSDRFARPLRRRLPDGVSLPHLAPYALVGLAAFVLTVVAYATERGDYYGISAFLHVLLTPLPLLITTMRPVLGWWSSLLATWLQASWWSHSGSWPWSDTGFVAQVLVLLVLSLTSPARAVAGAWVVTALVGGAFVWYLPSGTGSENNIQVAAVSFMALLTAVLLRAWYDSRREVVAQTAVTAVERSRRTVLEERTTIARELHDVVAHHMSVVAIQAEAAPYRVTDPPPELTRAFATIRENAVAALTELRRILGVVRAAEEDAPDAPQPTLALLDSLLSGVRDAGLPVEKAVTGAVRELSPGVELSAYRIVQEALSNALRHAPGSTARVELSYVLGGLGLRVVNGPPTGPVPPSPGAGHGLTGMRERVAMLGGELVAQATPDGGWETTAFLPARPDDDGQDPDMPAPIAPVDGAP